MPQCHACFFVAVSVQSPAVGGEVQVPLQVADHSIKRRRLSVKGPALSLDPPPPRPPVADPSIRHRRLMVKGPAPFLFPRPPPLPTAVLPLSTSMVTAQDEATFDDLTHRRKYRLVYNKFSYCFLQWSSLGRGHRFLQHAGAIQLALKDFQSLSKRQKNLILQHFLHWAGAPPWILQFAVRQWPCDADEHKPKLFLKELTALLTFQGDWGVLELGPNLPQPPRLTISSSM